MNMWQMTFENWMTVLTWPIHMHVLTSMTMLGIYSSFNISTDHITYLCASLLFQLPRGTSDNHHSKINVRNLFLRLLCCRIMISSLTKLKKIEAKHFWPLTLRKKKSKLFSLFRVTFTILCLILLLNCFNFWAVFFFYFKLTKPRLFN